MKNKRKKKEGIHKKKTVKEEMVRIIRSEEEKTLNSTPIKIV